MSELLESYLTSEDIFSRIKGAISKSANADGNVIEQIAYLFTLPSDRYDKVEGFLSSKHTSVRKAAAHILLNSDLISSEVKLQAFCEYLFHTEALATICGAKPLSIIPGNYFSNEQLASVLPKQFDCFFNDTERFSALYFFNKAAIEKLIEDPKKAKILSEELGVYELCPDIIVEAIREEVLGKRTLNSLHLFYGLLLGYPLDDVLSYAQWQETKTGEYRRARTFPKHEDEEFWGWFLTFNGNDNHFIQKTSIAIDHYKKLSEAGEDAIAIICDSCWGSGWNG